MLPLRPLRLFIGSILLITSTLACATAQRTFVASFGDDTHPCSIAQPCRQFVVAVAKTNPGGEVIVLDSAGYGTVTISKSISIIAPSGVYAGISVAAGNGITINAPGATVVLRGLSINGQGGANGILVQQAARVRVESCVISNMGAQGIYHNAPSAEMIVLDTIVRDNADGVALVASNAAILLDHVRTEHNQNSGFYVTPTVVGGDASATIVDSVFAYNGAIGIWADSIGSTQTMIDVQRSVVSKNGGDGFYAVAGASNAVVRATLRNDVFSGNHTFGLHVLATFGAALGTILDNSFTENYSSSGDGGALLDGDTVLSVSRNAGQGFACQHYGGVETYQDNSIPSFEGCFVVQANRN